MSDRTITVEASGRATASPETVHVEITARARGETQTAARRGAGEQLEDVRTALQRLGVEEQMNRQTARVKHRSSLFDTDDGDPPYRAIVECALPCRPDRSEDVFLAVGDAGGEVTTMDRSLTEERHETIESRALSTAVQRARRRAETIAETEGVSVGDVRSVTWTETGGMGDIVDEALTDRSVSHVDLEPIEVTAAVRAVFEIEA